MNKKVIIPTVAAAFMLTACQTVSVPAGQTGVLVDDYTMIKTDPVVFDCQKSETSEYYWNVRGFQYPSRQISWDATGQRNQAGNLVAERDPYIVVSSSDAPAELRVPVVITFDLTSNCEDLKQFHRDFGTKYLPNDEDEIIVDKNDGWVNLLNYVIGQPAETTLLSISQKYNWRQIWNDEKVRIEYQKALQDALPAVSKARTNGKEYFTNFQVTVVKPDPVEPDLKNAIVAEQAAIAEARAAQAKGVADAEARKAKADADVIAAVAETDVARQKALQQRAEIEGFPDVRAYLEYKAIEAGRNPFQPTYVVPQGG